MTEAQERLIRAAGLRPKYITVVGYAPECEGEPELLTGVYGAATVPAFAVIRRVDQAAAVAALSSLPYAVSPTEMERERLNACADADGGVPQERVIAMVRERQPAPDRPNTDPEPIQAPDLVPYTPPLPLSSPISAELSDEHNEGWG